MKREGFQTYASLSLSDFKSSFCSGIPLAVLESATFCFGLAFETLMEVERLVFGVDGDFGGFVLVFPEPA